MDPIAVVGAASSLVVSLAKASKSLSDVRNGFQEAPLILVSMITECKTITAALAHLQTLTLRNPIALSSKLPAPNIIRESFDNALTGCMLILSALETQLEKLTDGEMPENIGFSKKVRLLWNEETMTQLLVNLRGQHAAINTLISLFQTESLANVQDLLRQHVAALRSHRARSLLFYQRNNARSPATQEKELSIFNFSMQTYSFNEATNNLDTQLQQSTAYQNANTTTLDKLRRQNNELKIENKSLRTDVNKLEQDIEQKGHRIIELLNTTGSLQTQRDDLNRQLQLASKRIDLYHKVFKATSGRIEQQILKDRHEIEELETRLSSLRKSHGNSILSRLIEYHDLWKEPGPIATSSLQSPVKELVNVSPVEMEANERPGQTKAPRLHNWFKPWPIRHITSKEKISR